MTVCAGSRYFDCCGDNAAPREIVELLRAVADAGLPTMTVLRSTAEAVAEAAAQAGIRPPAVCVIGAVAGLGLT